MFWGDIVPLRGLIAPPLELMGSSLTVVSNRLPLVLERADGDWAIEAGSGGLVQAMRPLLEEHGGRWIGWPGTTADPQEGWRPTLEAYRQQQPYDLVAVPQSEREYEEFYAGFANAVLWPLFHGFAERCNFEPAYWEAYRRVNEKFAGAISASIESDDLLWVHDYHLMMVPEYLDTAGLGREVGFFLHIPFPGIDTFKKLPWRDELLEGLLGYDLIGLQARRDLRNFVQCVEEMTGASVERTGGRASIEIGGEQLRAGVFPIGCNYEEFATMAGSAQQTQALSNLHDGIGDYQILLGVDRLDYTKGLIERFRGLERALEKYPSLREEIVLYQLVVPSRESVREYRELKGDLDRIIGRVDGRFSTSEWQPIHYRYMSVSPEELSGLYRYATAEIVTSLCDGLNLVSKEYCAAQVDETGTLVLSEFTGAADQLGEDALVVNPYDREAVADAMYRAVTMPRDERVERMRRLRETVRERDVFWWADEFLGALAR